MMRYLIRCRANVLSECMPLAHSGESALRDGAAIFKFVNLPFRYPLLYHWVTLSQNIVHCPSMSVTLHYSQIREPDLIDVVDDAWAQDKLPNDGIELY